MLIATDIRIYIPRPDNELQAGQLQCHMQKNSLIMFPSLQLCMFHHLKSDKLENIIGITYPDYCKPQHMKG